MSERIRQLEDALQSKLSPSERHPLLSNALLEIKNGIADMTTSADNPESRAVTPGTDDDDPAHLHESFGTLAMTDSGGTRFIGNTGRSEVCV